MCYYSLLLRNQNWFYLVSWGHKFIILLRPLAAMVMPGNPAKLVNFANWGKNTLFWVHHQRSLGLDVFFKCNYSCLNIFLMLFIWLSFNLFYFFLSRRASHSSSILCSSSRSGIGSELWAEVKQVWEGLFPVSWEELISKGQVIAVGFCLLCGTWVNLSTLLSFCRIRGSA